MVSSLTEHPLLERLDALSVWRQGDQRAPHKPLLILIALARLQRDDPRLLPYREIEQALTRLLQEFGPPRRSFHPEYPFWHLQADGLWEVAERGSLEAARGDRERKKDVPAAILRNCNAHGGFPVDIYNALRANRQLLHEVAGRLLETHFPHSIHGDILDAVGFDWEVIAKGRKRDPLFRETILRIYERRCGVCGYDGRLGGADLGLEAAHVRWHTANGPDSADNGIALCAFHHKLFDRGAIGLDEDLRIIVSQDVHGAVGVEEWIVRFSGQALRRPQVGQPTPAPKHVLWHQREVFHGPGRAY